MISIVFFGSGPVAAKSLELLGKAFEIEAVITKPRPPHHKGDFPVLDVAQAHGYTTILVSRKAELDTAMTSHAFHSQLAVLVDFGIIVSQTVIDSFPLGIVNSHFSLLPEWRGADPITFSILSGQQTTGVSLMLLVEKMDEGPILACGIHKLSGQETTPQLTEQLILLSDALLKKELPGYVAGETKPLAQDKLAELIPDYPSRPSYSKKLTKADGVIDWQKPAAVLEREVRAYLGWPGSRTQLAGKDVIITRAHAVPSAPKDSQPGYINAVVPEAGEIAVTAGNNSSLWITRLKPAGKRDMSAKEFINGHKHLLKTSA